MDKYVEALEVQHLEGKNAKLFFGQANSSFDENFKALKSLQQRLHDIIKMDESSMAYQTALHQITEQEQGEAGSMNNVFNDCWMRGAYPSIWNPVIVTLFSILQLALIIVGVIILMTEIDSY